MRTSILTLAAATTLTAFSSAQNLTLDKVGGGLGQPVSFPMHGQPNEPYVLLFDLIEQQTTLPALGLTLEISDQFAWFSFGAPTWAGVTNGSGDATALASLPNDPTWQSLTFSLQAVAGFGPFRASNLARLTPQLPGTFAPSIEQPSVTIAGGGAVKTADQGVLFVGGSGPVGQQYSSRTEQWTLAGVTFGVGLLAQTTELADGRVLFTGGIDLTTGQPTANAAIYDPATQLTTTLTMSGPRAGHGASRLGNGKVLVTGGLATFDLADPLGTLTGVLGTTELFDPATGAFTPAATLLEPRAFHTSTTTSDGQVLIAGGLTLIPIINLPNVSSTAYRYNPTTGSFGLPSFFTGARFLHSACALSDGKVLLAGGLSLDLTTFLTTGNIADIIIGNRTDCLLYAAGAFGFGTFTTVNGMQVGRAGAGMAALPNGGALIAGGLQLTIDAGTQTFEFGSTDTADVFRQGPNGITPTGSMAEARIFPVLVPLADGTVLTVGGGPASAEIFQR